MDVLVADIDGTFQDSHHHIIVYTLSSEQKQMEKLLFQLTGDVKQFSRSVYACLRSFYHSEMNE